MKKIIRVSAIVMVFAMLSVVSASACKMVKGDAKVVKNPDDTWTISCPTSENVCYTIKCEGSTSANQIQISNGMEGTLLRVVGEEQISEEVSTIQYAIFIPNE